MTDPVELAAYARHLEAQTDVAADLERRIAIANGQIRHLEVLIRCWETIRVVPSTG